MISTSRLSQPIELPGLDIGRELTIPGNPVELEEPRAQLHEFLGRQRLNRSLDLFDLPHVEKSTIRLGVRNCLEFDTVATPEVRAIGRAMMPGVAGLLTSRFDTALAYAVEAHRTQARKGTAIPYVGHLLGVAAFVIQGRAEILWHYRGLVEAFRARRPGRLAR